MVEAGGQHGRTFCSVSSTAFDFRFFDYRFDNNIYAIETGIIESRVDGRNDASPAFTDRRSCRAQLLFSSLAASVMPRFNDLSLISFMMTGTPFRADCKRYRRP